MSQPSHLEYLEKIRSVMVERRRYMAMDRVEMWKTNGTKPAEASPWSEILDMQRCIEGIDQALADEKKLLGPPTATFGTYGS